MQTDGFEITMRVLLVLLMVVMVVGGIIGAVHFSSTEHAVGAMITGAVAVVAGVVFFVACIKSGLFSS